MNNEMIKVVTENRLGIGANKIATNDSELSSNRILKATTGGVTNSNITDDGTTVTIEKPIKATSGVSATSAAATTGKFTGDLIGNALTADTLKTPRTLKIGDTNKEFDGSANVAWTHNEIGVSQGSHVVYSYGGFGDKINAWGWTRIASMSCLGYGTFTISKSYSTGSPRAVKFFVAPSYRTDNGRSIVQLGGTNVRFSKARIVYDPLYDNRCYIEVYYQYALSVRYNNLYVSLSNSYLTTLLTSATQGEIPDGWASYECNFTDNGLSAKSGLFNNLVIDKGANNETASLTIGSSSAPATLNVYGKSTLKDRLTVPKDESNSTSGIIDAGDSYYLGGNRWVHYGTNSTNTAMGLNALLYNAGTYNTAIGRHALSANPTDSVLENVAVGNYSFGSLTKGSRNVAIGGLAGHYIASGNRTSGDNGIYIGNSSRSKENDTNNEIVIGANAIGLGSNSMVLGHTTNLLTALRGKVGIGTNAPAAGLHVVNGNNSDGNAIIQGKLHVGTVPTNSTVDKVSIVTNTPNAVPLFLQSGLNDNDNSISIGFKNVDTSVSGVGLGATISFVRTGGYSKGDLYFSTKENVIAAEEPLERMRIKHDGRVGIGKNNPTEQLNSINNIKADAKLIAGTHVEAGGDVTAGRDVVANRDVNAGNNITAVETVQGKNINAVASGGVGGNITADGDISADMYISAGKDITAESDVNAGRDVTANRIVTGFVVNAIKDINAGNNITATETVTGKNLVATQSITAGTTIDAGGNITSDDTVQGNYVKAVKKNGYGGDVIAANDVEAGNNVNAANDVNVKNNVYAGGNITSGGYVEGNYVRAVLKNGAGGDVTAANDVLGNNNVEAGNDVIASKEVKAGQAINTSYFTSLNNGEYLMDCNHNKLEIPLHLGNEAMICGIITNSRHDLTSEDILLELPLGTSGRLFQVETMLAFRIIVSDGSYNEYILREETININSIISTLNDSNGYKIQKHKVMSDLCVGYNIAQNTVTAWESDYEYEHEQDSLLPSDFFTFEKTFLGAAKLKPKATLDEHKIAILLYETGFESRPYNIEYSYKINTNILGTSSIMNWAKK